MTWVLIRSWHALKYWSATDPTAGITLCGRRAAPGAKVSDTLPSEKSCEACLRLYGRQQDK